MGQGLHDKRWTRIKIKVERRDDYLVDLIEGERLLHHILNSVHNYNRTEFLEGAASAAIRFTKDKGVSLKAIKEGEKELILSTDDATVFTFWIIPMEQ